MEVDSEDGKDNSGGDKSEGKAGHSSNDQEVGIDNALL